MSKLGGDKDEIDRELFCFGFYIKGFNYFKI